MSIPPVVYVGPSLEPEAVQRLLPRAQVMPPIRRGDLYRDRLLGFRLFLILDGVFLQNLAVSPREVIDVIQDGATVAGASSLGAVRAAECWPGGMRGIGTIYRLFRRGVLTSDDEVAVSLLPHRPYRAASVPLINVRYACARALRDGTIRDCQAEAIVRSAAGIHFSERSWWVIARAAGLEDSSGSWLTSLEGHDLKRRDALRALWRVRRWIDESPDLLDDPGGMPARRFTQVPPRELPHEWTGAMAGGGQGLWRWLVASGRYRRYAAPAASLLPRPPDHPTQESAQSADLGEDAARTRDHERWVSFLGIRESDLARALHRLRTPVFTAAELTRPDSEVARAIWTQAVVSGDAEAEALRFRAGVEAVAWTRDRSLQPDRTDRALARATIAQAHGFRTWEELADALAYHPELWSWIEEHAADAARAKRARRELFEPCGAAAAPFDSHQRDRDLPCRSP